MAKAGEKFDDGKPLGWQTICHFPIAIRACATEMYGDEIPDWLEYVLEQTDQVDWVVLAERMATSPDVNLLEVSKVNTFGTHKYTAAGWRTVPGAIERYKQAFGRHVLAHLRESGQMFVGGDVQMGFGQDPETGLTHLAHAATNAMMVAEFAGGNVPEVPLLPTAEETRKTLSKIAKAQYRQPLLLTEYSEKSCAAVRTAQSGPEGAA